MFSHRQVDQGHSDSYCSTSLPVETALHRAVVSGGKAPAWVLWDKLVQGEGAGLRAIGQVRAGKPQQKAGSFSRSCSRTWVWISWEQSLRQIQNSLERIHLIWSRMASGLPRKRWRGVWGGGLEYLPSVLKPQPQIGEKKDGRVDCRSGMLEQQRCCSSCSSYSCSANRPLLLRTETQNTNRSHKHTPTATRTHTRTSSLQTKWLHAAMTAGTYTNMLRGTCWWKFKSIGVRTKAWQEGIHKHYMCMHYADTCTHRSTNTQPIYLTRRGKSTHHFTPSLPLSSPQIRGIWPSVGQIKNVLISHANEAEFIFHNRWPHR